MKRVFTHTIILLAMLELAASGLAADRYVDGKAGADSNDGTSAAKAVKSIQAAVDRAEPGDTVLIAPGVYYESVAIKRFGTKAQPITIKATGEAAKTIITGADQTIREKKQKWTPVDAELGLYSIPFNGEGIPSRVLYDGVDLFPYASLDLLKQFGIGKTATPGPKHGFVWEKGPKLLYVRLRADKKYGSADPNEHIIAVAPPAGAGLTGTAYLKQDHANISLAGEGASAFVTIEGFTFETPGIVGVNTTASDVTVKNCIFVGCRAGVGGNAVREMVDTGYSACANNVAVLNCTYTQFPAFDDGIDTLKIDGSFAQRRLKYDGGLILRAGKDWEIGQNLIHDSYKAISAVGMEFSQGARIHDNQFERIVDNAIETENHARDVRIFHNVIKDCFSPFSWQPIDGKPWPGPIYFYQNVIFGTPEFAALFVEMPKSQKIGLPPVFRIGSANVREKFGREYIPEIADPGLLFFNNTVFWNKGSLFWAYTRGNNPEKLKLNNNILVSNLNLPNESAGQLSYPIFTNNLCAMTAPDGLQGQMLQEDYPVIGLKDPLKGDFQLSENSPAIGKSADVPGADAKFKDIGAVQQGDSWYPLKNVGCGK